MNKVKIREYGNAAMFQVETILILRTSSSILLKDGVPNVSSLFPHVPLELQT